MAQIGNFVIYIIMACAVAGAIASIFDQEKGLGKEFLEGIYSIGPIFVPVAGIMLLLGVDRFMSEARAITNFIGNTVATLVIAKWEGAFDSSKAEAILARPPTGGAPRSSP